MTSSATVKLHRDEDTGAYCADTPRGRVEVVPNRSDTGRVDGWWTGLENEGSVMHRTLRDAKAWIASHYL